MASTSTTSRTVAPVRVTTAVQSVSRNERIAATEPTSINVLSEQLDNHDAYSISISPMENILWPKLAQKAPMYIEYDINSISFNYEPIKGTSYSGQLAMAVVPHAQLEGNDFNSAQAVLGLACNASGTVSGPLTLTVPLDNLSKSGKRLFMPGFDVTVQDTTNYFAGNFILLAYNCDTAGDILGRINVTYNITLRRAKIDTSASASRVIQTGLVSTGEARMRVVTVTTSHMNFTYASVRPQVLFVKITNPTGTTILLNGVAAPAGLQFSSGGAVCTIVYLGRHFGQNTIDVVDATGTVNSCNLFSAGINIGA